MEAIQQEKADWLSPTEALTRFRPPDVTQTDSATNTHAKTFFGFRVGHLRFLVVANIYCEVIEQLPVNPLPNVENWFSGLLNLRGNLVPVIDLAVLLNEHTIVTDTKRHLFTIDQGEKAMALWIDELPEIHHSFTQPLKQLPILPALLQRSVVNGYLYEEQIWLHVKFDNLFKALGKSNSIVDTGL
jgi:twitching motility protein PilI